jgi:hypothetical protein
MLNNLRLSATILIFIALTRTSSSGVIVSELYRDPPGTETDTRGGGGSHEFIELTNLGPDTFFIDSLFITNGAEADSVTPETSTIAVHTNCRYSTRVLEPGGIALILDPDYRVAVTADPARAFALPDSTLLLRCGDGEFGSSGLAATHGVVLYRGTKTRIDTVICNASGTDEPPSSPTGEKITLAVPENIEGVSLVATAVTGRNPVFDYCPTGISPGTFEPLKHGWIAEFRLGRFNRSAGTVPCTASVLSTRAASETTVAWQCNSQRSGTATVVAKGTLSLRNGFDNAGFALPADSSALFFTLKNDDTPSWRIDLSAAWLPEAAIRISEIFPKATSGEPEWFEVENRSSMPINLKNWRFGKEDDTVTITPLSYPLAPGSFTVISRDGTLLASRYRALTASITPKHWITLGNTGDTIMLFDGNGTVRETVCYSDDWFPEWPSTSIERTGNEDGCSADAWSVAERPTPGFPGEGLFWRNATKPSLDIGPIPFTPDGDGSDDRLAIRIQLPPSAAVTITIYGFDGRAVKTFSGLPQEAVYWDGRTASGSFAPPGPFFVVAEVKKGGNVTRLRKKGILWRR